MRWRVIVWCGVTIVMAGALATVGLSQRYPAFQVHLRQGAIWLASNQAGQLTLLDGSSEEVAARIKVAEPDTKLLAVQLGSTGYAVNQKAGTITRIDGATFEPSTPPPPLPGAENELSLVPAQDALYALNARRGVLAQADPRTLATRGALQSLAGQIPEHGLVVDEGTLWVLDGSNGDLVRYAAGSRRVREHAGSPSATRLAVADGPVLVDQQRRVAELLDRRSGDVIKSVRLDVREGEDLAVGGAGGRVLLSIGSRGLFMSCSFANEQCTPVTLGSEALSLGPAVESGGRAFVPDYTRGHVFIVDLATGNVIDRDLFGQQRTFELLVRDGYVFYNDPDGDEAGVIRLDGHVRRISKYEQKRPDQGTKPVADQGQRPEPKPDRPADAKQPPVIGPDPVMVPGTATPPPGNPSAPPPEPAAQPTPEPITVPVPRIVRLTFSPSLPEVGEVVTATAVIAGGTPQQWEWSVRQNDRTIVGPNQSPKLTHTFDAPGSYEVSLTVSNGTASATRSAPLTVAPPMPAPQCGEMVTTNVRLRTDVTCPPNEGFTIGADNITIDLNGHTVSGDPSLDNNFGNYGIEDGVRGPAHRNVTIMNGTFGRYFVGVYLHGSHATNLVNVNVVVGRRPGSSGVVLEQTTGVTTIQGGTIEISYNLPGPLMQADVADLLISGTTLRSALPAGRISLSGDATIRDSTLTQVAVGWSGRLTMEHNQVIRSSLGGGGGAINAKFTRNAFSGYRCICRPGASGRQNTFSTIEIVSASGIGIVGVEISGNTFDGAAAAGVFIQAPAITGNGGIVISGNRFSNNGYGASTDRPSRDSNGSLVNDGLHITAPSGSNITVINNHMSNNADYGIEAVPGTVIDGGGNVSSNDPHGCLGVACA